MSIPVIAFFNNKGGVGKTSLVYHLAWMYAELGVPVVAADFERVLATVVMGDAGVGGEDGRRLLARPRPRAQ
jgi:Mrp family chromosome partitioning ATPase